mmetsp:Transcript_91275/g.244398  ORF Transcript_91275/g.244398 Transcript_91275/m.244398 type:complete len:147 (-) Transcript_91275:325-765(-)
MSGAGGHGPLRRSLSLGSLCMGDAQPGPNPSSPRPGQAGELHRADLLDGGLGYRRRLTTPSSVTPATSRHRPSEAIPESCDETTPSGGASPRAGLGPPLLERYSQEEDTPGPRAGRRRVSVSRSRSRRRNYRAQDVEMICVDPGML